MRALLDTHTLLWFAADDPRLSQSADHAIRDRGIQAFVSVASLWEIGIKIRIGKLKLDHGWDGLLQGMKQNDLQVLPVTPQHVVMTCQLPFHHRDPFDRMLVAQALVEDLTIVSADSQFDAYGIRRLW